MKRALLILTILGLALSPMMVSQAQAATTKHKHVEKHHKKQLKKKTTKRLARKHAGKATV